MLLLDRLVATSFVKWYGKGTRSEYRLTGFSRDFPRITSENLGSLLVLIPRAINRLSAYVFDIGDDIEDIQAALGVEVIDSWALYEKGTRPFVSEGDCVDKTFRRFAGAVEHFPRGEQFSETTQNALLACVPDFQTLSADDQLVRLVHEEYELYKIVERKIRGPEVQRLFSSIDDFLQTAQRILQARKSRAGRSLENHVEYILRRAGVRFEMRQTVGDTKPDIIIPGKRDYENPAFPDRKLFVLGVKTTCKDRWRQVTKEAPRIRQKHLLTLQKGISGNQMKEIHRSQVTLVVPKSLHKEYPPEFRNHLLTVEAFVDKFHTALSRG